MKYKHILVTRPGGLETLQIKLDDLPEPKVGEVRVKLHVAGVSFADLLMREGVHPQILVQADAVYIGLGPGWYGR